MLVLTPLPKRNTTVRFATAMPAKMARIPEVDSKFLFLGSVLLGGNVESAVDDTMVCTLF